MQVAIRVVGRVLGIVGVAILAGCGVVGAVKSTLLSPPPVPDPLPPSVSLTIQLSPDGNPSPSGRPSPLMIRVYQLRGDDAFRKLELEDLDDHDKDRLGEDILARSEWTLHPGESHEFHWAANADAKRIGVVAWLRNYRAVPWQLSLPIDAPGGPPAPHQLIEVQVDAAGIHRATSPSTGK